MQKYRTIPSLAILMMAAATVMGAPQTVKAQQGSVGRKVLLRQSLPIPGYEVVQVFASVSPGEREGKHTHPGTLVGYVLQGAITMERQGQSTVTYKVGDSFVVEPDVVHEGINNGKIPYAAAVTFIVKKGKPLTTPVH